MPAYEREGFSPPAPVVCSLVRGPEGRVYQDVPLLLDTGADVTVLPLHVANAVVGRNIPNLLVLTLDGPRQDWSA